jgi:hypothetical protein
MVDEIVRKIGAKPADCAAKRSHQMKSRGRAAIPLVDADETPSIVMSVESFDALERKLTRDRNPICHANDIQEMMQPRQSDYCVLLSSPPALPTRRA